MIVLGRFLKNRRAGSINSTLNYPNLAGPEIGALTSSSFRDGDFMRRDYADTRVGGNNTSPDLCWSELPTMTKQLLLVVEDLDSPFPTPFIHCMAVIDPLTLETPNHIARNDLLKNRTANGVQLLRSSFGTGYNGPAPIKGHGPHRYYFQLYALATPITSSQEKVKPRTVLREIDSEILGRSQIIGLFER
jgi:Raf kinase inhibitor-like YbhB/YbcL family protein